MKRTPASTAGLAVAALVLLVSLCAAQFPLQMNYQVMLTNDADEPLADQSVQLVFRIYDVDAGGGSLWNETHNVVTNHIGVASVVLGSVSPMSLLFDAPLWLQVEVDGQTLMPRRPLTAAPYALRARDADYLGGEEAMAYALDDDLWQPGTLNNPANPLEWTKLKNMPAGFADGVDNAGSGDGHSLDASDGSPTDVVRVEADGTVRIGTGPEETFLVGSLYVSGEPNLSAAVFDADSRYMFREAVIARADSASAIVGNAGSDFSGLSVPIELTGVSGIGLNGTNGGFFWAAGAGKGATCVGTGSGPALHGWATGTGYSGYFEGGEGVLVESEDDDSPTFRSSNLSTTGYGDAGWFLADSGVSTATWTLYSRCYEGLAGYFIKHTDDNSYAMSVQNELFDSEGLYVYGTVVSTGTMARVVETSRGSEAVLGVASADLEVIASGKGRLAGGAARIEFDRLFAEAISGPEELRVTATPIGGWSAMYVASVDGTGFDLKSGAGDPGVEFYWMAVGRAAGNERRPEITIPDIEEERETARLKLEAAEPVRSVKRENPVHTTSRP